MQNNNRIKNKSGLLSIIVPVYNTEKYLTKCSDILINIKVAESIWLLY